MSFAGDFAEFFDVLEEAGVLGVDDGVGAEGGDDASFQPDSRMHLWYSRVSMGVSVVERTSMLNFFEEGTGAELGGLEARGNDVVVLVGVVGAEAFWSGRIGFRGRSRTRGGWEFRGRGSSFWRRCARLRGGRRVLAVELGDAEGFERNALGVEHAEDVVVGAG